MAQEYVNLISPGSSDMADSPSRDMQILIVDDQRMIAEILGLHLATTEGFDVSQADSLEATFKEIRQNDGFDIILLDYRMPGMQGIESVARIVEANHPGKTILFSGYVDSYTLNRAIKVGVRGLIPKSLPVASVGSIIALVHSGEIFIPASEHTNMHLTDRFQALTDVERMVLGLTARGGTNKQIAIEMGETESLVKKHMRLVCRKLGARNRAHAAILGREMNLFY